MGSVQLENNNDYVVYVVTKINEFLAYTKTRTPSPVYRYYKHYMLIAQENLLNNIQNENVTSSYLKVAENTFHNTKIKKYSFFQKILGYHKQELSGRKMAMQHLIDIILSYRKYNGYYPDSQEDWSLKKIAKKIIEFDNKN